MNEKLPDMLRKYFWDCDFDGIDMNSHDIFIAERILNFGDMAAVEWLMSKKDSEFFKQLVRNSRNLDRKTRNYWKIILSDHETAH